MAATPEILSKLNIGSGMNNSEIIAALVNAERAPALERIEKSGNYFFRLLESITPVSNPAKCKPP